MACYHPLSAWQTVDGNVVFAERGQIARALTLPCGQCVGCRLEKSRHWAMRCVHESKLYETSSFVTLTYSPENNPITLTHRHFQLFMKRLRKKYPRVAEVKEHGVLQISGPRFYMCGEYGETTRRPHYHALLFGVQFDDCKLFSERAGVRLYTSKTLDELWKLGQCTVGALTWESAAYCSRYVMKKITGEAAEAHYQWMVPETGEVIQLEPEYNKMSLKPGLGADWFKRWHLDVFGPTKDRVVINGMEVKPPRYYREYLDRLNADLGEEVDFQRYLKSCLGAEDRTPARLADRETVTKGRLAFFKRSI